MVKAALKRVLRCLGSFLCLNRIYLVQEADNMVGKNMCVYMISVIKIWQHSTIWKKKREQRKPLLSCLSSITANSISF